MLRSSHLCRLARRVFWPAVLASLFLAAPAYADVSPQSVVETLNPGGSIVVPKTVSTPAIPPKPDIFFLADTTGSMGAAIANVRTGATNIMNLVRAVQPDAQFGVGSYKDANCDLHPYQLDQAVTASIAAAQTAIDSWSASGGCDAPEAQLHALTRVATDPGTGFRTGSSRIIVWFGDQPGHDPSVGATLASTISALDDADVRVIAISTGANLLNATGQATALTGATGGVFQSGINDSAVSTAITSALQNLPVTVTPQIVCDSGLTVTLDLTSPSATVPSGDDVTYDETITVDPASPGGVTLFCTVTFLLNGQSQPGFTETICVIVNGADVAIVKTGPALVTEGQNLTWTLTAHNNGPATATGVTVSDALPANTTFVSASADCSFAAGTVTCAAGTLTSGQSKAFTITATAGSVGNTITNTAGVVAQQFDPVPANNVATVVTQLNHNPVCTNLAASGTLWPPNHKLVPVSLAGATDADGNALTYSVTGVTQDEATNGLGDGDTAVDAVLGSGANLWLRAERSGTGDGRVYRIAVTVTDGNGGSCTTVVRVGVPHDQSPARSVPVDSGGVFNSLI